jgi:hypothetical protein
LHKLRQARKFVGVKNGIAGRGEVVGIFSDDDTEVALAERTSIVQTVAEHHDVLTLVLQTFYKIQFFLGTLVETHGLFPGKKGCKCGSFPVLIAGKQVSGRPGFFFCPDAKKTQYLRQSIAIAAFYFVMAQELTVDRDKNSALLVWVLKTSEVLETSEVYT